MVIISLGTEAATLMMVSELFDKNHTEGFTKYFCCFTLLSVAISKTNYELKKQKKETTARTAIYVAISILLLSLRKPENVVPKSFRMKVELGNNDFRLVKRN